jgi:hypothetical protein
VRTTYGAVSWNHSVVPPRRRLMSGASKAVARLLIALAIGGCASGSNHALDDHSSSSSTPSHGALTNGQFNVAVTVARAEIAKEQATVTSATATVGKGTVTDPNAGPACASGTLLHIKLIGTFPNIAVGGYATDAPPSSSATSSTDPSSSAPSGALPTDGSGYSVNAVLITADPASGKPCLLAVQTGPVTPDPGATLLFTH